MLRVAQGCCQDDTFEGLLGVGVLVVVRRITVATTHHTIGQYLHVDLLYSARRDKSRSTTSCGNESIHRARGFYGAFVGALTPYTTPRRLLPFHGHPPAVHDFDSKSLFLEQEDTVSGERIGRVKQPHGGGEGGIDEDTGYRNDDNLRAKTFLAGGSYPQVH